MKCNVLLTTKIVFSTLLEDLSDILKKKKLIERHKSCRIIIKAHLLLLHLEEIMLFCLDNKELTGHVAYCSCEEGFISLTT